MKTLLYLILGVVCGAGMFALYSFGLAVAVGRALLPSTEIGVRWFTAACLSSPLAYVLLR